MPDTLLEVATQIVRASRRGFLTTLSDGHPRTRIVEPLVVEDDGTLWIGTSPASRKALDIGRCPEVTYAAEDRDTNAAACLYGEAELVDDPAVRAARWREHAARVAPAEPRTGVYFPGGPTGDDFVLVRLHPTAVEVIDFTRGIHPPPFGLRSARGNAPPLSREVRPAAGNGPNPADPR